MALEVLSELEAMVVVSETNPWLNWEVVLRTVGCSWSG